MRRRITVGDAFEDVEVHLHQLLDFIEHAPDHRSRRIARELFDVAVGHQVDVEFGADAFDHLRQRHANLQRRIARRVQLLVRGEQVAQQRHVVLRWHRYAVEDHDGLDLAVQDRGEHRILDAADEHRLVNHRVLDAPQAANLVGELRPRCRPAPA